MDAEKTIKEIFYAFVAILTVTGILIYIGVIF